MHRLQRTGLVPKSLQTFFFWVPRFGRMGLIQTSAGAIYFNELLVFQRTGLVPKYRKAFFLWDFLDSKGMRCFQNVWMLNCLRNSTVTKDWSGSKISQNVIFLISIGFIGGIWFKQGPTPFISMSPLGLQWRVWFLHHHHLCVEVEGTVELKSSIEVKESIEVKDGVETKIERWSEGKRWNQDKALKWDWRRQIKKNMVTLDVTSASKWREAWNWSQALKWRRALKWRNALKPR